MGCGASVPSANAVKGAKGFYTIPDRYRSLAEVSQGLRQAGLESSNLVIAIDYTKSNTYNGERTFGGRSLHWLDHENKERNPYEQVIEIIGKTLEQFDDDQVIPVFGFGDSTTRDTSCFPFYQDRYCYTLLEVLARYHEITQHVDLGGPTNFGPVIRAAIEIVKQKQSYHIMLIIADGQVQKVRDTIDAIVEAAEFQFVPYHDIVSRAEFPEASFATAALQEIPDQFKLIQKLGLLDM